MNGPFEVHVCPVCGRFVEWQGNDYGYLCNGEGGWRSKAWHADAEAEPARAFLEKDVRPLWEAWHQWMITGADDHERELDNAGDAFPAPEEWKR
jgi:hypothetical protein